MNYKISCLVFIRNPEGKILLLNRKREPNKGFWSPPGGKLNMLAVNHLLNALGEKPWRKQIYFYGMRTFSFLLMYLKKNISVQEIGLCFFDSRVTLDKLPNDISEGTFAFFGRDEIDNLKIPPTDHQLVWPLYDKKDDGFWGVRADFSKPEHKIKVEASPNKGDNV